MNPNQKYYDVFYNALVASKLTYPVAGYSIESPNDKDQHAAVDALVAAVKGESNA